MEKDREIIEAMLGMVYEKARSVYSENIVDYGTSPTHYGVITDPDGYASVTGTWGDTITIFLRARDKKIEDAKFSTKVFN